MLPYFAITGAFLAKFNRYMIPILPFVMLMAAGMIWRLWRASAQLRAGEDRDRRTWLRSWMPAALGVALATAGVAGGIFWSVAYVNGVYRGEHTWITASRWIYEHVPRDSVILWESWDDPLPKAIPGEPGMDMGSRGLRNIDWSPYEEDTAEKYEILKAKLREADYVAYSSKRIYASVDELPERYPMTTRYYEAMRDGRLGYEVALDVTSPPRLFGFVFEDRRADESWSLYDHPQVTVLRKVRDLSDAEFDAVLGGSWEGAIPYSTGDASSRSPILTWLGLRGAPGAEHAGVLGAIIGLVDGSKASRPAHEPDAAMLLAQPLSELPVVDNYRWNVFASERSLVAALVWWLTLTLLGWAVWPLCFGVFASLRDRGYFLSRMAGWLAAGWLLWVLASAGVLQNTVSAAWLSVGAVALAGGVLALRQRRAMAAYLRSRWPLLAAGELGVALAYVAFLLIRMANPDLWQPWFGGEKFMEFAFLNGILRSPTFPPVDPHFAGGFINYYYFGIYLAAYLIKLTGIYAEVGFNLTIAALFALTVSNAFSVAYSAWAWRDAVTARNLSWRSGFWAAWIAPLFVAVIGNLDGFAQIARRLTEGSSSQVTSALAVVPTLSGATAGLGDVLAGRRAMPAYDFWAPSRVIPNTINEFPYWSFLFADLHPHLIGIPLAILFCGAILALLGQLETDRMQPDPRRIVALLAVLAFLLGALSSVNLWELPTYFVLGALALAVLRYHRRGTAQGLGGWLWTVAGMLAYGAGAYLFFFPFFSHYVNVGASGVGWVREPDAAGTWLLIWGFFGFLVGTWLLYASARRPGLCRTRTGRDEGAPQQEPDGAPMQDASAETEAEPQNVQTAAPRGCAPTGVERAISLGLRQFDRLPRLIYLHRMLVRRPALAYLGWLTFLFMALAVAVAAMALGHVVVGLCLGPLALAWLLLWRRGADSDPVALFVALLATVSLAILAGTQVVFLRDFLQGGDWYRMNTLFKFFSQVWVLLALATAVALPRMWYGVTGKDPVEDRTDGRIDEGAAPSRRRLRRLLGAAWVAVFALLLIASLAFTVFGSPARLSQRLTGWHPPFGTLNGMDYMRQGSYTWPDDAHRIELSYDWDAIQWLLQHVRGNPVVVESAEADYYRAGSSRVASLTGMSGLRGMHESEQRSGQVVSARETLQREFWESPDIGRTQALIDELGVTLVYVGQLERQLHPAGVQKIEEMASLGLLQPIYENERTTVYAVVDRVSQDGNGIYTPVPASEWAPSVGYHRTRGAGQ